MTTTTTTTTTAAAKPTTMSTIEEGKFAVVRQEEGPLCISFGIGFLEIRLPFSRSISNSGTNSSR